MSASTAGSAVRLPFKHALYAMLGIGLVNMLIALDQTVVSTALPSIVSELKGFEYYAWIANAYLLASVVSVPVFGRLGDYFGRKPFAVASVILFTLASLLCGAAPDMRFLALARALQGLGGGMMVGTAFASIPDLFPDPRQRVRWQVVMAAAYGIGTAAGPSLGGLLSQAFGWRSTFLVNLPVGLASLWCVARYLPRYRHHAADGISIDIGGTVLIVAVLGSLQTLVERLPEHGIDSLALGLLAVVALGSAALLWCERRVSHPMIPLELFRHPDLVTLFILALLSGFIMFSLIFFVPLMLQGGFGLTPRLAGLLATPLAACIALGSLSNSSVLGRLKRPTDTLTFGFAALLYACFVLEATRAYTSHWVLLSAVSAAGVGLGFILNNLNIFGQEIAGPRHFGITTALFQSLRMVGGMLGTTLIGTLIQVSYASGALARARSLAPQGLTPALEARLSNPQLLIDPAMQHDTLQALRQAGLDGRPLLEACREVLVGALHTGIMTTGIAALIAALLSLRLKHIRLRRAVRHSDTPPAH